MGNSDRANLIEREGVSQRNAVQPDKSDDRLRGKRCSCGMTLEEFRKTGLLGCADCYVTFRAELLRVIERTQHGTVHTGRTPSVNAGKKTGFYLKQKRLREEMEIALKNGDEKRAEQIEKELGAISRIIWGEEE